MKWMLVILIIIFGNFMSDQEFSKQKFISIETKPKLSPNVKLTDVVMAHRGLWGYYPEHSLRGFELAYFMNTHYLETDVNLTKDGKVVIIHDATLDYTTNIDKIEKFSNRRRNETIGEKTFTNNFFVSDFTAEELDELRLKQRSEIRPTIYDGEFKILFLEEFIKFVLDFNNKYNKSTGIYIEPKYAEYYQQKLGMNLNAKIIEILKSFKLDNQNNTEYAKSPVVIQSFEFSTNTYFRSNSNLPLIQLMTWGQSYNLSELAKVVDGVGPDVDYILYERIDDILQANGVSYKSQEEFLEKVVKIKNNDTVDVLNKKVTEMETNKFVDYAHTFDLYVQPYTFKNDVPKFSNDPVYEYALLRNLGVDAFFSDFCDSAIFGLKYAAELRKVNQLTS